MSQNTPFVLLGVCALLGMLFISGGMTSYVVADSPDEGPASISARESTALSAVGLLIITVSAGLAVSHLKASARKSGKKEE